VADLESHISQLQNVHGAAQEIGDWTHKVLPALLSLRKTVDALETVVPNDAWPLPTYQEMLFIR
jgi:glutamine synthetase